MEEHHYELRNRSKSRSQTPKKLSNETTESENINHHYDLRSRDSRERSLTPGEVTSSRRSKSKSHTNSGQKTKGQLMDPINEIKDETQSEYDIDNDSGITVKRRSERQRVKRQLMTNGQNSIREQKNNNNDDVNKRKSQTPKRTITSDYSSEEGEREDPPSRPGSAYEIYKQAGDWWNVFPKTDYTYSQTSQCRYEIAPGVLAMPNMSRPSIHSDGSSTVGSSLSLSQQTLSQTSASTKEDNTDLFDTEINDSIQQNRLNEQSALYLSAMNEDQHIVYKHTHVERFSRQRVVFGGSTPNISKFSSFTHSDNEFDDSINNNNHRNYHAITYQNKPSFIHKYFGKLWYIVTFLFIGIYEFIRVKILRREKFIASHDYSYRRYEESKWTKFWSKVDYILQYLYLTLIRVLFLDSWILSHATPVREGVISRRKKLLLLILLPPLIIGGIWFYPGAKDMVLSKFSTDVFQDFTKLNTMDYLKNQDANKYHDNFDNAKYDEMKKTLEILINRFEKLEAQQINQKEHNTNIDDTVNDLKISKKNALLHYEEKLSNLESKLEMTDDSTSSELNNIKLEFKNLQNLYSQVKSCCNKIPVNNNIPEQELENRVKNIITTYFGADKFKSDIHEVVENVIKAQLIIQQEETLKNDKIIAEKNICNDTNQSSSSTTTTTDDYIRKIVIELLKIYDADKTGRVDYALESAGGQIISIRCTQRFNINTRAVKLFGLTLFYESGDPRTVIQGNKILPGICWAFQDFPGYLLIKLRSKIKITGFTMEHASKKILPNNEIKSAPRKFNVWGSKGEHDQSPIILGEYEFIDNDETLQYFPIENQQINHDFEYIELRIHSNHGQLEYTCLYRFRVHGIPI